MIFFPSGTEILIYHVQDDLEIEILASSSQVVLGTFLPFIIILGSNIVIIAVVKSASAKRRTLSIAKGQGQDKRKDEHLTRMLVFVSLAYFVTSLPFRLFHVLMDVPVISEIYDMGNTYWNLRYLVQVFFLSNIWSFNVLHWRR
jgi:Ca2+/Na+ antiporter